MGGTPEGYLAPKELVGGSESPGGEGDSVKALVGGWPPDITELIRAPHSYLGR